jgi:glycosyltransferase involved in cell wall biosynthesis
MVAPVGANDQMAEAIAHLLEDPRRRKAHGERLRRRVREHYRAEAVAAAYGAFYQRNYASAIKGVA